MNDELLEIEEIVAKFQEKFGVLSDKQVIALHNKVENDVDVELTTEAVQKKILELPVLYVKYRKLYFKQRRILKNINNAISKTKERLFKRIRFGDYDYHIDRAQDVYMIIDADADMRALYDVQDRQEVIVDFIKSTCDNMSRMSYQIRNFVELEKLRNGVTQ